MVPLLPGLGIPAMLASDEPGRLELAAGACAGKGAVGTSVERWYCLLLAGTGSPAVRSTCPEIPTPGDDALRSSGPAPHGAGAGLAGPAPGSDELRGRTRSGVLLLDALSSRDSFCVARSSSEKGKRAYGLGELPAILARQGYT